MRYVVYNSEQLMTLEGARKVAQDCGGDVRVYEVLLMVPPDYGPLVAWLRATHEAEKTYLLHKPECEYGIESDDCTCGLADAFKAAGIGLEGRD